MGLDKWCCQSWNFKNGGFESSLQYRLSVETVSNGKENYSTDVLAPVCHFRATDIEFMRKFFGVFHLFYSLILTTFSIAQGDSGGPLINNRNKIVGIAIGTCPSVKALSENHPRHIVMRLLEDGVNIYSNLYYYRDFVQHFTNESHHCRLMK